MNTPAQQHQQLTHDINLLACELAETAIQSGFQPVGFGRKNDVLWFGMGGTADKYSDVWEFPVNDPRIINALRSLKKNLGKHIQRAKKASLHGGAS